MKMMLAAIVAASISTAAIANEAISGFDLLLNAKASVGKTVEITGCEITSADMTSVLCAVSNKQMQRIGSITIQSSSLERASLRRAVEECADWVQVPDRCHQAVVIGRVREGMIDAQPEVVNAKIRFRP